MDLGVVSVRPRRVDEGVELPRGDLVRIPFCLEVGLNGCEGALFELVVTGGCRKEGLALPSPLISLGWELPRPRPRPRLPLVDSRGPCGADIAPGSP